MSLAPSHLLLPGMFGFGQLASYDYFVHLERALVSACSAAGDEVRAYVADVSPTASIRRRGSHSATSSRGPTPRTAGRRDPPHRPLDRGPRRPPRRHPVRRPHTLATPALVAPAPRQRHHHQHATLRHPLASIFATVSGRAARGPLRAHLHRAVARVAAALGRQRGRGRLRSRGPRSASTSPSSTAPSRPSCASSTTPQP